MRVFELHIRLMNSVNMLCLCLYTYFVLWKATTIHDTKQKESKVVSRKRIPFCLLFSKGSWSKRSLFQFCLPKSSGSLTVMALQCASCSVLLLLRFVLTIAKLKLFHFKCPIIDNCNRQKGSKKQEKRLKESGRNLLVNRRRQKTSPQKARRS